MKRRDTKSETGPCRSLKGPLADFRGPIPRGRPDETGPAVIPAPSWRPLRVSLKAESAAVRQSMDFPSGTKSHSWAPEALFLPLYATAWGAQETRLPPYCPEVNVYFISSSLLSGCSHGTEDEETPSEQNVSVRVSQSKAGSSTQKTQSCEMCVPVLKDILHLADLPGQKPYLVGECTNHHQHQKHHSAKKSLKRDMDRASYVKRCLFRMSLKPFRKWEVGKDLPAMLGLLRSLVFPGGKKPNTITEYMYNKDMLELFSVFSNKSSPLTFLYEIMLEPDLLPFFSDRTSIQQLKSYLLYMSSGRERESDGLELRLSQEAGETQAGLTRCWCGAEDEGAPSAESISVAELSQGRTPKADTSTNKSHPCEIYTPVLRDVLRMIELKASPHGQKLYLGGASDFWMSSNLLQLQKLDNGEKLFEMDGDQASFMMNCSFHVSGKPFMFGEVGRDFSATSGLLQLQVTPSTSRGLPFLKTLSISGHAYDEAFFSFHHVPGTAC
ncbi:hypothetical protein H8959_006017 [Pygathrix nigripes]